MLMKNDTLIPRRKATAITCEKYAPLGQLKIFFIVQFLPTRIQWRDSYSAAMELNRAPAATASAWYL